MRTSFAIGLILGFTWVSSAAADEAGTAGGEGIIDRFIPNDPEGNTEPVPFAPRYSFAYREGASE